MVPCLGNLWHATMVKHEDDDPHQSLQHRHPWIDNLQRPKNNRCSPSELQRKEAAGPIGPSLALWAQRASATAWPGTPNPLWLKKRLRNIQALQAMLTPSTLSRQDRPESTFADCRKWQAAARAAGFRHKRLAAVSSALPLGARAPLHHAPPARSNSADCQKQGRKSTGAGSAVETLSFVFLVRQGRSGNEAV